MKGEGNGGTGEKEGEWEKGEKRGEKTVRSLRQIS